MTNIAYKEIENYVCDVVSPFVTPINNIESIKCARLGDRVYMELVHEDSCARYFDISDHTISDIGMMVGYILSNKPIKREITDRVDKKEIRKLFR